MLKCCFSCFPICIKNVYSAFHILRFICYYLLHLFSSAFYILNILYYCVKVVSYIMIVEFVSENVSTKFRMIFLNDKNIIFGYVFENRRLIILCMNVCK